MLVAFFEVWILCKVCLSRPGFFAKSLLDWQRFLGLVKFTDESYGSESNHFGAVGEYLQTQHVSPWIMFYAEETKSTGRSFRPASHCDSPSMMENPSSPNYVGTLVKTVYALAKAFVVPSLGGPRSVETLNYMDNVASVQKTALQKLKLGSSKLSGRGMVVKASGGDEEGPSAKTFITTKDALLMEVAAQDLQSQIGRCGHEEQDVYLSGLEEPAHSPRRPRKRLVTATPLRSSSNRPLLSSSLSSPLSFHPPPLSSPQPAASSKPLRTLTTTCDHAPQTRSTAQAPT